MAHKRRDNRTAIRLMRKGVDPGILGKKLTKRRKRARAAEWSKIDRAAEKAQHQRELLEENKKIVDRLSAPKEPT